MKAFQRTLIVVLTLFALTFSVVGVAPVYAAATRTVTKVADTNDGVCDSDCSLREAIAVSVAGDTIVFNAGLSGQVIRVGSQLEITKNLTIDGSSLASPVTLSGDSDGDGLGNVRVMYVNATVTLNSIIIADGLSGSYAGGIYNNSTLTLANMHFNNNYASWSGGAIRNYGVLNVTNSSFSNNSTGSSGGGIENTGTLLVNNSTFQENHASDYGGGIFGSGSSLTVTNSTFYGNYAYYGGGISGWSMTLKNNTFSDNRALKTSRGSGIDIGGAANLANNIIANSLGGYDCFSDSGTTFITNANNLIEDGSCYSTLNGDPVLASLADNGGPTKTMALIDGSKAIDAGNDTYCSQSPVNNKDQRGVVRPVGSHCDIGAYEGSVPDTSSPKVTTFNVPATSASLKIPITTFIASDNVAVTGYKVTTSSTQPTAGSGGWVATPPKTFTVSAAGTYKLYPWAKDSAGNVSAAFSTPRTVAVMKERSKNGGFNTYTGTSKVPTGWNASQFVATDGKDKLVKHEGTASVKIVGTSNKTKTLKQTILLSGKKGDKFVFSFWVKGTSIPATPGFCRGQVMFYNGTTLLGAQTKTINCATGTTGFQKKSLTFTVGATYTKVVIQFTYSKASGSVWFDTVSLMR